MRGGARDDAHEPGIPPLTVVRGTDGSAGSWWLMADGRWLAARGSPGATAYWRARLGFGGCGSDSVGALCSPGAGRDTVNLLRSRMGKIRGLLASSQEGGVIPSLWQKSLSAITSRSKVPSSASTSAFSRMASLRKPAVASTTKSRALSARRKRPPASASFARSSFGAKHEPSPGANRASTQNAQARAIPGLFHSQPPPRSRL